MSMIDFLIVIVALLVLSIVAGREYGARFICGLAFASVFMFCSIFLMSYIVAKVFL